MSRSLPASGGILGARIAQADGRWIFPGNPVFFYPAIPTDRLLAMLREAGDSDWDFLDLVRQAYGPHEGRDDIVESNASIGMTADERAALLLELELSYNDLAREQHLTVTWDDVVDAIVSEDGFVMPNDVLAELFADKDGVVGVKTPDDLSRLASIFFNAWSVLPRESLGGASPAELHEGYGKGGGR